MSIFRQVTGSTTVQLAMPSVAYWEDQITVATLVIAASTVVSLIVSVLMWNAMRRQTQLTQDIFEAAHRPYVGVLKLAGGINKSGSNPAIFNLSARIKNSGNDSCS